MIISLWVHGMAGNVDVFDVSGEKIHSLILEKLIDYESNPERMDWFGDLPTERRLNVVVDDISDEDGINLEVVSYSEDIDLDISYENYKNGIIIVDYTDKYNIRYCGKSFTWTSNPTVLDPFESKFAAEEAAYKYFCGS